VPREAAQRGYGDGRQGELTELDAQVEGEQGGGVVEGVQAELAQGAGEAEAVDEAEREHDGSARGAPGRTNVVDGDAADAQRDQWLDDARRHDAQARRGEHEGGGVREREAGDDAEQRAQVAGHEQQRKQKQQVVVAGQDVLHAEAEPGEEARRRRGRLAGSPAELADTGARRHAELEAR